MSRTPSSPNALYREYRQEGRDHAYAVGQVAHAFTQGANSGEEEALWEERLRDVALEFDGSK